MRAAEKPKDKRRERGEESRRLILQAAILSIASLGLSNMTLDRVAEKAGVSRGLVVFHFKSKNKLHEEVLQYLGRTFAQGWDRVKKDASASNLERLIQLVDYDIRFAYENPNYVSTWLAFWGESKGNFLYQNLSVPRDERYSLELEQLIAGIIDEGGYDREELKPIAMALSAILFGVWIKSHLSLDLGDCDRYLKAMRLFLSKSFPRHTMQ